MLSQNQLLFRPFMETPEPSRAPPIYRYLRHPIFAWLGLRPTFAQHTRAEHEALREWARGRRTVVELGVAEGGSAVALREAMAADGTLYLIDPFHLSRIQWLNAPKRAARAAVARCHRGRVVWVEKFSFEAARDWTEEVDFLFFDGDHSEQGVRQDWEDWHRFIAHRGVAAFHDARVFPNGWPTPEDGPVKLVNGLFRDQSSPGWTIVQEMHSLVIVRRE